MGSARTVQAKTAGAEQQTVAPPQRSPLRPGNCPVNPALRCQQTLGNQTVLRLLRSGVPQAKLAVSRPGDMYEREADRVAEQVVRMPDPTLRPLATAGPDHLVQRKAETATSQAVPDSFTQSLGPGRPLDAATRVFFEPRFGQDFSHVRVHTDARAAESARSVNALAYTVGRDVVFGEGHYAPGTSVGRRLLAHELTHVVQQQGRLGAIQRQPAAAPAKASPEPPAGAAAAEDFLIRLGEGITVTGEEIARSLDKKRVEKDVSSFSAPGIKAKRLILNLQKDPPFVKGGSITADLDIPFVRNPHGGVKFLIDKEGKASFDIGKASSDQKANLQKVSLDIPALNGPTLALSLKEGALAGELSLGPDQFKSRLIPNLAIPRAGVTVGITAGKLSGKGSVALEYQNLAKGEFSVEFKDGRPAGKGTVALTPDYLKGAQASLQIVEGNLQGDVSLPASKLASSVPGLKVSAGTVALGMKNGQLSGTGKDVLFDYQNLGKGTLNFSVSKDHLEGSGELALSIPGFAPIKGALRYRAGKLSGEATIAPEKFPKGLPVRAGAITVLVDEQGRIAGRGSVGVYLLGAGEGELKLGYEKGILDISAAVELTKIPGLETGSVQIGLKGGKLEGSGEIGVAPKQIPGLAGKLLVAYKEDRFSGKARLGYAMNKLSGDVELVLGYDDKAKDKGKMVISGSGEITARLTDWLTGKVHIDVLPDATTKIAGKLTADDVQLFPEKKADKELFNVSQNIPLWAIVVAVIRLRGGVRAGVGPGMLRGITAEGEFSTKPGIEPSLSITGELFIPAYAEAYIAFGAGLGLDVVIGSLTGGIEAVGTAGIYGAVSVIPEIAYQGGNYSISGVATMAAGAKLKLGLQAWAEVEALWVTVWSNEWKLAEWMWDVGPELALQAQMNYVFGRPEPPTFEFKTSDIDSKKLIQDAMPKEGPRGSGAREALKNKAEWKGKLKGPGKEAGKVPPALAEKSAKPPAPKPPSPKKTKAKPPADLKTKEPAKSKAALEKELKEKATPGKSKPEDKAHAVRAALGFAAIEKLVEKSKTDPEDEKEIAKDLAQLKAKYKFAVLTHRLEGMDWVIEAGMSPTKTVRVSGVDPKAPDGTEKKPFPITWPKRESEKYPVLYFGGRINKIKEQKDLAKLKGKKDETGTVVEEHHPHGPKMLHDGKEIGLGENWRTYKDKCVAASGAATPGGRKLKDALEPYGFKPSVEGMDADHVVEIQTGGIDDLANLWPLDSSENQHSGRTLKNLKVKMPDGKEKTMREMKDDTSRKYWFTITNFEF